MRRKCSALDFSSRDDERELDPEERFLLCRDRNCHIPQRVDTATLRSCESRPAHLQAIATVFASPIGKNCDVLRNRSYVAWY